MTCYRSVKVLTAVPSTASTDAADTVRCRLESKRNGVNILSPGLLLPDVAGTGIGVAIGFRLSGI